MNHVSPNHRVSLIICILIVATFIPACDDTPSGSGGDREPLPAPSHDLLASEIMIMQGISSIHYQKYMRFTVDGVPDSGYHLVYEYYLDTNRVRVHDYPRGEILMYDKATNTAWQCYQGSCSSLSPYNIAASYNSEARYIVGSWLDSSVSFLRSESIDGKFCDVFSDTTGAIEWVWIQYRVPVQLFVQDSIGSHHLMNEIQMRSMEINKPLPDSVFQMP